MEDHLILYRKVVERVANRLTECGYRSQGSCCGASLVCGIELAAEAHENFNFVRGMYDDPRLGLWSHVWLWTKDKEIVVDPTADQFSDHDSFYVGEPIDRYQPREIIPVDWAIIADLMYMR